MLFQQFFLLYFGNLDEKCVVMISKVVTNLYYIVIFTDAFVHSNGYEREYKYDIKGIH